jgi:hypothetical protein
MLESLLRRFSPFWLMKDVSRGTREERIAAHRFNRRRRGELTACMRRWVLLLAPAALLTARLDALGGRAAEPRVFACLAAACATVLACGVCVLFVTGFVYVYLSTHES